MAMPTGAQAQRLPTPREFALRTKRLGFLLDLDSVPHLTRNERVLKWIARPQKSASSF
jgi:hypothetical protein